MAFGVKNQACFNYTVYAARMREDDIKMSLFWAGGDVYPLANVPYFNIDQLFSLE